MTPMIPRLLYGIATILSHVVVCVFTIVTWTDDAEPYIAAALAQVEGMQGERDKMKRRMHKLTAFYNSSVGVDGARGGGDLHFNGGGGMACLYK